MKTFPLFALTFILFVAELQNVAAMKGQGLKEGEERGYACEIKGKGSSEWNAASRKCCAKHGSDCKTVVSKDGSGAEYHVCVDKNPDEFAFKMHFCCADQGAVAFFADRPPQEIKPFCKAADGPKEGDLRGYACEIKGKGTSDWNEVSRKCCERYGTDCKTVVAAGGSGAEYHTCVQPKNDELSFKMQTCCFASGATSFFADRKPEEMKAGCKV